MTPWTDNSGKTWDLDQPFTYLYAFSRRYDVIGWFNPVTQDDGVRHDPRPVLGIHDRAPAEEAQIIILDTDNMSGWPQSSPEPEDPGPPVGTVLTAADPEPPYGVVIRDSAGIPWHRTDDDVNNRDTPGRANWEKVHAAWFEPESWVQVAGNGGHVTVISND